jgi:hypothetical protein
VSGSLLRVKDHTREATHVVPMGNYVIAKVGNYVIVNPSNLGNCVIADNDEERSRATSTPWPWTVFGVKKVLPAGCFRGSVGCVRRQAQTCPVAQHGAAADSEAPPDLTVRVVTSETAKSQLLLDWGEGDDIASDGAVDGDRVNVGHVGVVRGAWPPTSPAGAQAGPHGGGAVTGILPPQVLVGASDRCGGSRRRRGMAVEEPADGAVAETGTCG